MSRVDEAMRRAAGTSLPVQDPELFAQVEALIDEAAPSIVPAARDLPIARDLPMKEDAKPTLFERIDDRLAQKVVIDDGMNPMSREQYRRLAATLHHAQAANGLKVILIASAVPGEGKTLTASNLALTFSESYQRNVLLVDADLRRPSLHTVFNIERPWGLSEGLDALDERRMPVSQLSPRLSVLVAGRPSPDPMAGLTSERMRRLIGEARESFDWVIVDTPPIGFLPDASLLASMADGVVLVVKADSTPYEMVKRAVDALGDRVLGVVLNRATTPAHSTRYGYAYDYTYAMPAEGKRF